MNAEAILLSIAALLCLTSADDGAVPARGFNDNIQWKSLEPGVRLANEQNKPIMMLIHKTWCGACKALKPKFSEYKEIEELSRDFIMVNIQDDEEPKDKKYYPDGGYIPRILFLDQAGNVMDQYVNELGNNDQYKYYYPMPEPIAATMEKVLSEYSQKKAGLDEL